MAEEIADLRVELRVLAAQVNAHQAVADNRHAENRSALKELEEQASQSRHGLRNVDTKVEDLNVKLVGWPEEHGQGGIKGDIVTIRTTVEALPALLAMQRSAGLWNGLSRGGKAIVSAVLIGVLITVFGAIIVAALAIGGAHP